MLRSVGTLKAPSTATRASTAIGKHGSTANPQVLTLTMSGTSRPFSAITYWRESDHGWPLPSTPPLPRSLAVGVTPML